MDSLFQIRGSGAFRRFKDAIHGKEIQDDWYRFRREAFISIASVFLESEGIAFVDDFAGGQRKECMVALSEEFRPLAIPVLGQFQFFPHPAAVVRRLSLTGGAASCCLALI